MKITYDEFFERYKPTKNHLEIDRGWDGCLYETFGEELKYIIETQHNSHVVWTMIEDDDKFITIPGFWRINRMGYFVTQIPWSSDEFNNLEII